MSGSARGRPKLSFDRGSFQFTPEYAFARSKSSNGEIETTPQEGIIKKAKKLTPEFSALATATTPRISESHEFEDFPVLASDDNEFSASKEFNRLWRLSYPIVFTYLLEFLPDIIGIMLVGQLDSPLTKDYVSAATLSSMFMYLSGEAPSFGMATALDTICSQAFGAGRLKHMGISFQTGLLIVFCMLIPILFINWNSDVILKWMGQPITVALLAGRYSRYLIPGLPFLVVYDMVKKVLQAQNIVRPMLFIAILNNIVNTGLGIYLTWYTSFGFEGAAIARSIANVLLILLTWLYFVWRPDALSRWWPGWQFQQAIKQIKVFLSLGIPGMFMLVTEWLSFEIMAVFAGWLPDSVVAIDVHSVLANIANVAFHFYLGISVATTILVGNYIGCEQPYRAKIASIMGLIIAISVSLVFVLLICVVHKGIPALFINDSVTITECAKILWILIPFEILDAINCILQAIFRGTGHQTFAAVVNFIAYFVIGLPLGIFLAFRCHFGVLGFWFGLSIGYAGSVIVSVLKLLRMDWNGLLEDDGDSHHPSLEYADKGLDDLDDSLVYTEKGVDEPPGDIIVDCLDDTLMDTDVVYDLDESHVAYESVDDPDESRTPREDRLPSLV